MPLPSRGSCGTCTRCIEACPTDAIIEPNLLDFSTLHLLSDNRTEGEHSGGTTPEDRKLNLWMRHLSRGLSHGIVKQCQQMSQRSNRAMETLRLNCYHLSV